MPNDNLPLSSFVVNTFKNKKGRLKFCLPFRCKKAKVLTQHYIFFTFAAPGPFAPLTISNSTLSPSAKVLKPSD